MYYAFKASSGGGRWDVSSTFLLLAVSAYVTVVTVQGPRRGVGLAAVVLRIQRIDCYVNQMQQDLADVTVSVWVLLDETEGEKREMVISKGKFSTWSCQIFFSVFLWDKKKYTEKWEHKFLSWPYLDKGQHSLPSTPNHRRQRMPACSYNSFQENHLVSRMVVPRGTGERGWGRKGSREANMRWQKEIWPWVVNTQGNV